MGAVVEVSYFNSYKLLTVGRATQSVSNHNTGTWPALPWNPIGYPQFPVTARTDTTVPYEWYIEEARIRGGYNNTSTGLGPRAYVAEDNDNLQSFSSGLIY